MTHKVLVLPGDGVGPEIVAEALKLFELLRVEFAVGLEIEMALVGGVA
jgi:3-isopropylmalate dehydrogenase